MANLRISGEHTVLAFGPDMKAVATAENGSIIEFETLDCFANQITDASQRMADIDETNANPATGPVYINGAEPGDTLKVEILKMELGPVAVACEIPGEGVTGQVVNVESVKVMQVADGICHFSDDMQLPLNPMIGVIGTANSKEWVNTETPDYHGGNLDCIRIGEGATLYLPVMVEGALLGMGDLHACMGDGEVGVSGAEIPGLVTVRVTVLKDCKLPLPFVVNDDLCATMCSCVTLDEAADRAVLQMRDFLMECCGVPSEDAGMLMSLSGDLRINQVVNPKKTCRMELPMAVIRKLGYTFE
ncbi:MAG: acetamidase/formamidase family protein [Clostridiales bacterium]|nr:acetamidase/formamidase family protein [Candidatus Crickella merdequi]